MKDQAVHDDWKDVEVLVTGGTGRVGRSLVTALIERGARVSLLTRTPNRVREYWPEVPIRCQVGDLGTPDALNLNLEGIRILFHLASHRPDPKEPDPYEVPEHWTVTAEGTAAVVREAQRAGVARLVYFSSIKALGEEAGSLAGPVDETQRSRPNTRYGRAKLRAERLVLAADGTGGPLRTCVLRLPMVYGLPGGGNLPRMIQAIARNRFPPWPNVENRRSAIHVDDAVAAALLAARHPKAAGRLYFVTDGVPYSTRWLYERIVSALGRPVPNWGIPLGILTAAAWVGSGLQALTGRAMPLTRQGLGKLAGNAWYSAERIHRELGFVPRHRLGDEIAQLVAEHRDAAP